MVNIVKYTMHGYSGYGRRFLQYRKHIIGIIILLLPWHRTYMKKHLPKALGSDISEKDIVENPNFPATIHLHFGEHPQNGDGCGIRESPFENARNFLGWEKWSPPRPQKPPGLWIWLDITIIEQMDRWRFSLLPGDAEDAKTRGKGLRNWGNVHGA